MRKKSELNIDCVVTNYIKPFPSYGIYSIEGDEKGLYYDRDFYKNSSILKNSYPDSLGGYSYELKEGTIQSDWQSGVDEELKLNDISVYREENLLKWVPKYHTGDYYVWDSKIYLCSNSSSHISLEKKVTDLDLNFNIQEGRAAIWKRNSKKIKLPWRVFEQREDVKGNRIQAFSIKNNIVTLSDNFKKKVGTNVFNKEHWEYKGLGTSKLKFIFSDYFPISKENFRLVGVENNSNKIIEFVESKNISSEKEKKHYYEIDNDLGIIKVGNKELSNLITENKVSALDTKINILNKDDLRAYPDKGYLMYNGNKIYYESKSEKSLEGVIITCSKIPEFSELSLIKNTYDLNNRYKYYIKYDAVPRFDYEVKENGIRTANEYVLNDRFLNLKPSVNYYENGVVQIDTMDKHVASLKLEVQDGTLIGENYYGDIYYNFYEILKATALDSNLEGVGEILITFVIESGPGYINGSKTSNAMSNSIGEAFTGFFAPYSYQNVVKKITKYEYDQNETKFHFEEILFDVDEEEVQLYQVLKIDPLQGTNGVKKTIIEKGVAYTDVNGDVVNKSYIKVEKLQDEDFDSLYDRGLIKLQNGVSDFYIDNSIEGIAEGNDHWVIFFSENYNSTNISIIGSKCFLFKPGGPANLDGLESRVWSANSRVGLNRLVYKWNDDVKHPIKNTPGAYYPLRPDKVEGNVVTYNYNLPEHKPYDQENSLGDYVVISPGITTVYAYCTDPFSGNTIVSNRIKMKISLPRYLNGVDFTETLPVPYGFRFKDENDNIASGIGGKTFLTVNPEVANKLTLNIKLD